MTRVPVAKVTRPVLAGTFPRKRLFRLIDRARNRPIVWVCGPAGSGKTTLVSSYLSARGNPCLWYRFDEGDQDVASFFHYMGLAARQAGLKMRKPLPLFTPEQLPGLSAFARRYFENLAGRLEPGTVLVLDNYQKIPAESALHGAIRDGLSRLPAGINALVVGRNGPPPVFARERVHQHVALVGWKELRLTPDETKGIVRRRGKRRRSTEEIRLLQSRSDGWAAGLVLLLEKSAGERGEPQKLADHATEQVFEYFAGEVFAGLDKPAKSFLLKSAFLPRMTAPMAERITGRRAAGTILAYLHRHNYFTEMLPDGNPVYAYHPLFRDFLLARARDLLPARQLRLLRIRAGAIFEESGLDEEAAGLYREAGDLKGMIRVILRQAAGLAGQGRTGLVAEWLSSLPKEACERDPRLLHWTGICELPSRPGESRRAFEAAFDRFRARKDPEWTFLALAGLIEAHVYGSGSLKSLDPWFATLGDLLKAHKGFPSPEIEARVTSAVIKGLALRRPSFVDAEEWAARATRLAGSTRDMPLRFSFLLNVAYYRFHSGDLQEVALLLDTLREMSRKPEISALQRLTLCWLEAACANLNGAHDRCVKIVTEGIELGRATGIHLMDFLLLGHGALSSLHRGEAAAAKGFLRTMAASLPAARPWEASFYHHLAAWEALSRGDGAQAVLHSDRCIAGCDEAGNPWTEALAHLQRASILERTGAPGEAQRHLERALRIGEESGMRFVRFACLMAGAYFSFRKGDDGAGMVSLREGLRIGRENGYVDIHLWHPGLLERLAGEALEKGIETDYAGELVRRNALVPDGVLLDVEQWPWPLRIHTLGRFELLKEGKPLAFSRKVQHKPLLMLKALISLGGKDVAEERITDVLWPEADGDLAHQSFATTLGRLRRLLGNEKALPVREGRLTLDTRFCWVDAFAFESVLARLDAAGHDAARDSREPRAVRLAERAVSLYAGSFLAGDAGRPWVAPTRERLRSKFLRAVGFLGRCLEGHGQWEEAVACYRKGLEVDDLAESFYQRLMICHHRLGQGAEANGVYQRCRKTLAAALGVSPSPETEAIARQAGTASP